MLHWDSKHELSVLATIRIDLVKEIVEFIIKEMGLLDVWNHHSLLSLAAESYDISVALHLQPPLTHVSP